VQLFMEFDSVQLFMEFDSVQQICVFAIQKFSIT